MSDKFERRFMQIPATGSRLLDLQVKASKRGLRGDDVYEFICLDREEQQTKIDQLEKENERLKHELAHGAKLVQHLENENARLDASVDNLERENAELKKAFKKLIHGPTSGSDAPETWVSKYASATLTKLKEN